MNLAVQPLGPFSLANQNQHFGGWAGARGHQSGIVMAFPVEGWSASAAVVVSQGDDGMVSGTVHGSADADMAWRQALAVLSLDVDGTGYVDVGERDPVIGRLQRESAYLRPVLFHSPYEAACSFVIGHRIRIPQGRAIRQHMAVAHGEAIDVDGAAAHAFPSPQAMLGIDSVDGLNAEKVDRLHGVARAALDGALDRHALRELPEQAALARLRTIRGIGQFFAAGILYRGAGLVDAFPGDDLTVAGMRRFYSLDTAAADAISRIADGWRPFRMWCSVLVQASERRDRAAGS
jgi:DNA-3-methyladenine glycosylase II